jgi:hypothetical protein
VQTPSSHVIENTGTVNTDSFSQLETQVAELTAAINEFKTQSHGVRDSPHSSRDSSSQDRNRSRTPGRFNLNEPLCWYHFKYQHRARKCQAPCSFRQSVKLNRPTPAAASYGSLISHRLFFNDRSSGYRYLVDTGADVCVIPPSSCDLSKQSDRKLYAANGTCIDTYGERLLKLDLGFRRHFTWNFIIGNVQRPIIGADFLHHYDLLVDLKHKRLIDSTTSVSTSGTLVKYKYRSNIFSSCLMSMLFFVFFYSPLLISGISFERIC